MPRKLIPCPLCAVPYAAVRQHLLKYHHVGNTTELKLLLNYACATHNGKLHCPVCKHKNLARLDKHIENMHSDIHKDMQKNIIKMAKRNAKLRALRKLRKSNPQPVMVTTLDLERLTFSSEEEEGEESPGFASPITIPSTPSVSSHGHLAQQPCQNCVCLWAKIHRLKDKLHASESQETLLTRSQKQQSTPQRQQSTPGTSARKKFERTKTVVDPSSLPRYEKVLNVWFQHISAATRRQEENARMRVTHVRRWLLFMAYRAIPEMTFSFLRNRDRLLEWCESLKKHAVTTQLIIIGNVRAFLRFLLEAQLPDVKAPRKLIRGVLFTLKSTAKMCRKDVQTHRQAVRIKKSSMIVKPAHISSFLRKATREIPAALLSLERSPGRTNLQNFYGLVAGFIVCTTGHRTGVLANLKVEEVTSAECDSSGQRIIGVTQHKTKETFGRALIPLNKDEYSWFSRFIYHRHMFPCGDSETFFSNSNGGPFVDLLESFQTSWKCFGLPGTPTFTLIRSSISTCIGRSLDPHKKANVCQMMCHSNATAEKFYKADLNFKEAFETRGHTADALYQNCEKSEVQDSDSEGAEEEKEVSD